MPRVSGGQITRVAEVNNRILTWTGVAPFPAQALSDMFSWTHAVIQVSVQCNNGSPEQLLVGNVNGQFREVPAGAVQNLPSQSLADVYVMSLGGTATFNILVGDGRAG